MVSSPNPEMLSLDPARRLPRPDKSGRAMTRGEGLRMTEARCLAMTGGRDSGCYEI